jgi:uncharacterized protein (DUF4415 family)
LPARQSETDWARLDAMSEADILEAARSDPDALPTTAADWAHAKVVLPPGKEPVTLRLDRDVLEWFRHQGRGYQTRINAVLRAFVAAQGKGAP